MCRMVLLMCTFDLNVLQGLPENPRHDVCEPHHLHDDLQRDREREQWGSVFQHLPDSESCTSVQTPSELWTVAKSRPQVFDSLLVFFINLHSAVN